jgi:hypothetical protein
MGGDPSPLGNVLSGALELNNFTLLSHLQKAQKLLGDMKDLDGDLIFPAHFDQIGRLISWYLTIQPVQPFVDRFKVQNVINTYLEELAL